MCTREAGAPMDSASSTATDAIGLWAFAATELARPAAPTLRKSRRTVSGSGRVATYGTGALASMRSEAPLPLTREEIAVSRWPGIAADCAEGADARTSVAATMKDKNSAIGRDAG